MNITMPGVATSHLRRVSALLVLALSLATGLSVLEFVEDAPGPWMLHCHVLDHAENGMMQHYAVTER